jgi:hypothetical protein
VSGQLHDPAALPQGKDPRHPLDPGTGQDDKKKLKFFTLPGFELRPLGGPARSQSRTQIHYEAIWTELCKPQDFWFKTLMPKWCMAYMETEMNVDGPLEIVTAVGIDSPSSCDITPCSPLRVNRPFGRSYSRHSGIVRVIARQLPWGTRKRFVVKDYYIAVILTNFMELNPSWEAASCADTQERCISTQYSQEPSICPYPGPDQSTQHNSNLSKIKLSP